MIKCGKCKKSLTLKELTHYTTKVNNHKSEFWCNDCYLTYSITCQCCKELFDPSLISKVRNENICGGCIVSCYECGWIGSLEEVEWPDDSDESKCPNCYRRND